jgi:hypothetical protein
MEPVSDDETSMACAFVECQLIEQDPEQATLNKTNTEYKVSITLCVLVPYTQENSIHDVSCHLQSSRN